MPGFVTHYLFGLDAYRQIHSESIRQNLHKNHSAFALGLQGPDIFFFYLLHAAGATALLPALYQVNFPLSFQ